MTDKAEEA